MRRRNDVQILTEAVYGHYLFRGYTTEEIRRGVAYFLMALKATENRKQPTEEDMRSFQATVTKRMGELRLAEIEVTMRLLDWVRETYPEAKETVPVHAPSSNPRMEAQQ